MLGMREGEFGGRQELPLLFEMFYRGMAPSSGYACQ
jgi:hypothetical protein